MNQIISNVWMSKLCLASFIFLCTVFTIEKTFSRPLLKKDIVITYEPSDDSIIFNYLFYDYLSATDDVHSFLSLCEIEYFETRSSSSKTLLAAQTECQKGKDVICSRIRFAKPSEKIEFINTDKIENTKTPPHDELYVWMKMTDAHYLYNSKLVSSKNSHMSIKWHLPKSWKSIVSFRISGDWSVRKKYNQITTFTHDFPMNIVNSKLKTMKNTPSVLNSEISNNVKVTCETDAILVKGAEPGEKIKVYTTSGAEIKSVVANYDVVNIQLPKNQIYTVKVGQTGYKVALCVP